MSSLLQPVGPSEIARVARSPVDQDAYATAIKIVEDIRAGGEESLLDLARHYGDLPLEGPLVRDRESLQEHLDQLPGNQRRALERTADRIRRFAVAQRSAVSDIDVDVDGGRAGHSWTPVDSVGAYAPGGRHPLPSSVLMTVVPARVAGVREVWVASPRPSEVTLAAAALAGADGLIAVGGAQAVAALAFGTISPSVDLIVGPGNKWVTAAKKHLFGEVGIDGLAGPSEILVIADDEARPELVAADLLAQAEHDPDAVPVLVAVGEELVDLVEGELVRQLADLPTAGVAREALRNGSSVVVGSLDEAADVSDLLAPEHLALHVEDPSAVSGRLASYGSLFIGAGSAEAFADYGAGPNHVLPTGGGARFQAGLSVFSFLKASTWLQIDDVTPLVGDTALLARLEGLEAHARAALRRVSAES